MVANAVKDELKMGKFNTWEVTTVGRPDRIFDFGKPVNFDQLALGAVKGRSRDGRLAAGVLPSVRHGDGSTALYSTVDRGIQAMGEAHCAVKDMAGCACVNI